MQASLIFFTLLLSLNALAKSTPDPSGLWHTFDDDGELESTVAVRVDDGKLYANVFELHNISEPNPACVGCKGDLLGKPVIGMQVINGLTLKKQIWRKGTLFDPKTGSTHRARVWLDDGTLFVRGYVGFLYQTKAWQRAP